MKYHRFERNDDMIRVIPTGDPLGARVEGIDLSRTLEGAEVALIREAIGVHGVLC